MSLRKTTQYGGHVLNNPWFKEDLAHGFKTMYGGDVVMFFSNKIKKYKILHVCHK